MVTKEILCGHKQIYTVGLFEEYLCAECFELNLARSSERRLLENYVKKMRMNLKIDHVWFGHACENHYDLKKYLEDYPYYDYLEDINL